MGKMPSYQNTVGLESNPVVDLQGSTQNLLESISSLGSIASKQMIEEESPQAQAEGTKVGLDVKQKLPGVGFTKLDEIKRNAAITARNVAIQNEITDNTEGIKQRTLVQNFNPTTAIASINSQMRQLHDTIISNTPPENRLNTENYLSMQHRQLLSEAFTKVDAAQKNMMMNSLLTNYQNNYKQAQDYYSSGNIAAGDALLDQTAKHLTTAVATNNLHAATAVSLATKMTQLRSEGKYIAGYFKANQEGNASQYIQEIADSKDTALTPRLKANVLGTLMDYNRRFAEAEGLNLSTAKSQYNDALKAIQNGANPVNYTGLLTKIKQRYGTSFPDIDADIANAQTFYKYNSALQGLPPIEAQKQLQPLYETNPRLAAQLSSNYDKTRKQFEKDPVTYLDNHGGITSQILAKQTGQDVDLPLAYVNAQKRRGQPLNKIAVMKQSEAAEIVNHLSSPAIGIKEKADYIKALTQKYKKTLPFLASQLNRSGLSEDYQLLSHVLNNPTSQPFQNAILNMLGTKPNVVKKNLLTQAGLTDRDFNFQNLNSDDHVIALHSFAGDSGDIAARKIDQIKQLARILVDSDKVKNPSDARDLARQIVLDNNYNVIKMNNHKVLVRNDVPSDQYATSYKVLENLAADSDLQIPKSYRDTNPGASEKFLKDLYVSQMVKNGYLIPDETQTRAYLYDDEKNLVKRKDGTPFAIELADLNNQTSPIRVANDIYQGNTIAKQKNKKEVYQLLNIPQPTQGKPTKSIISSAAIGKFLEPEKENMRDASDKLNNYIYNLIHRGG